MPLLDINVLLDAVVFSSLLTLLTMGLTLTYLTTKVPNFAHGSLGTVGIYLSLIVTRVLGANIYASIIPAFLITGLVGVLQYVLVMRPLDRRNASITTMMVATIAFELLLLSSINILADYLSKSFFILSRYFQLKPYDFAFMDIRGVVLVAPLLVIAIIASLHFLLVRTKFGIAMRATIENAPLAGTVGINSNLVYLVSWFIAGGLAGIAGSMLPLWFIGNPDTGSYLLISIFAAAVIGGIYKIYGAVIGGFVIGFAEILIIRVLASMGPPFGSWVIPYRPIIPLLAMVIVLMLAPRGITGMDFRKLATRFRRR
ncbi:MAG: branched-chain amino acid ABC transporter permease [Candidatus Methanosuratincola verstraetei]|jgi:branched-chain amino acid transport system permease protein